MTERPPDIRPYRSGDSAAILALVLSIQRGEFGMSIRAEDQPDLVDIPAYYFRGSGHFWVAEADGAIVGTVGLLDIGNSQGALRKMFVAPQWRGKERCTAEKLLACLVDWAAAHEMRAIYLGTTEWFAAAQRFYVRHGFAEISRGELPPSFPVMAVDTRFFRRGLHG